jgi:predicted nuclease of predicted toxin-antitoxin system
MPKPDSLVYVADENFDFRIVKTLREKGYSVFAIAESFPSISDPQVLQIAIDRNAILLTEDKDFGELVHRLRMPHCGILLVRLIKLSSVEKSQRICEVIEKLGNDLPNNFSVLSNDQLRIRPTPSK